MHLVTKMAKSGWSVYKTAFLVLISINVLILVPIGSWMAHRYHQSRSEYMYSARRPMLVTLFNILALLFIGLYTPAHILVFRFYVRQHKWWDSALFFTVQTLLFIAFALRIWHSFIDVQLTHIIIFKAQWKSILNSKHALEDNFFLRHREFLSGFLLCFAISFPAIMCTQAIRRRCICGSSSFLAPCGWSFLFH